MNLFSDIIRVSFSRPACWYCLLSLLIRQQAGVTFQFCSLLLDRLDPGGTHRGIPLEPGNRLVFSYLLFLLTRRGREVC